MYRWHLIISEHDTLSSHYSILWRLITSTTPLDLFNMIPKITKYFTFNYDRNIVELFKPLYILLSLTGLFPYTIIFPKGRHDTRILRKPLLVHILGAIFMIGFLCFYFTQRILISTKTATGSTVTNITNIIEISVSLLCAIVIYFCAFQNAKTYLQILRDIALCWSNLSHANVDSILSYLHKLFTYPAIAWFVVFSTVETTLCIIGTQKVYNQLIFIALPDAIPSLVVAFYCGMVLLIVGLLKSIEQHCQMVVGANNRRSVSSMKIDSTEIYYVRTVEVNDLIRLGYLEQMYVRALEIKQEVNNAFQAPISLIIIQCFHGILSDAHALYRELVVAQKFDAHLLIDQSFWVLYSLAKIYAMTFTGSLLKNEAIKIGQALHNIPTENQDNRLLMEVQHFTTLMSFRKPIITVYDYFSLDATLLFSMIATVVTYLVILVQFDTA